MRERKLPFVARSRCRTMAEEHPVAALQAEEITLARLLAGLIDSRFLIDVGAHHGTALEPFLDAGWQVLAFEPIEANRRRLAERFAGRPRLEVRPEAVSSGSGTRTLHLALRPDGSPHEYYHSLEHLPDDAWHRKGGRVAVPAVSLDDLAARGEVPRRVGFLKIDTEGHDLAVLRGAATLDCDVVSVEFWGAGHALGKSPSPPEQMIELLRQRGYTSYVAVCHHGEALTLRFSTWRGVPADAWGNLLFFGPGRGDLYRRVVAYLEAAQGPATTPGASRLLDVLGTVFPDRGGLTFLDVGAYRGDFTAALLSR